MIKGIAHVCIGARDLAAAEQFYCGLLGLGKKFAFKKGGKETGFYLEAGRGSFIEVFAQDKVEPEAGSAIRHLCLEVSDVDEVAERLRAAGVEVSDKKVGADGSWQAWLRDPSGIPIELHQYTDESSQVTGRDCVL